MTIRNHELEVRFRDAIAASDDDRALDAGLEAFRRLGVAEEALTKIARPGTPTLHPAQVIAVDALNQLALSKSV